MTVVRYENPSSVSTSHSLHHLTVHSTQGHCLLPSFFARNCAVCDSQFIISGYGQHCLSGHMLRQAKTSHTQVDSYGSINNLHSATER